MPASPADAVAWYDAHAADLAQRHETIDSSVLHGWLIDLLPPAGSRVLDVGAGTGRDAAWLAAQGYSVLAVEPSAGMREQARKFHPVTKVQWLDDALPQLACLGTARSDSMAGLNAAPFQLVLLSAVWQQVAPSDRPRAFTRLFELLAPDGLLIITLRFGQSANNTLMHQVSEQEISQLARANKANIVRRTSQPDSQGRPEVSWVQLALRRNGTHAAAPSPAAGQTR